MAKITLESGNVLSFNGDALVCFCDSDLTYKKNNPILQTFSKNTSLNASYNKVVNQTYEESKEYESRLNKELSAIGYCEIGKAVITQSPIPNIKHFIFVPYIDHNNPEDRIDYLIFHQALRSVFTLASLYNIKKLAVPPLKLSFQKKDFIKRLVSEIFEVKNVKSLNEKELMDITIAIANEFQNEIIKEVTIYR